MQRIRKTAMAAAPAGSAMDRRGTTLLRALIAVAVLAGCGVDEVEHTTLSAQLRAVSERMHLRFAAVERIEQGIVTSRLAEVRQAARTIASLDDHDALPAWQPYLATVRLAARNLADADDVGAAAHRAGELGQQCARCHVASRAHVELLDRPRREVGRHVQHAMAGHAWGVSCLFGTCATCHATIRDRDGGYR